MEKCACVCAQDVRKFGLIWFGAAISLAEIEAGLYCGGQPLAVILGHLLGGVLLYFAGLMGARIRRNGMECTQETFGVWGMRFFATANVLQLIGWTAVMISQGANAGQALLSSMPFWGLAVILGILVILWIFVGLRSFSWIVTVTMGLLLVLTVYLSFRIFLTPASGAEAAEPASFWSVFELSMAMPLSWLPLISDYTKDAHSPKIASATSAIVYVIGSLWMYFLGVGLASLNAENIAQGLLLANIGLWGLLIILVSTVTTTYLDAYSAGESSNTILKKLPPKAAAVAVCVLGTILSIAGIMDRYTDFLYLISSLFAPMAVAMLTDHFLVKHHKSWVNFIAFAIGFAVYHADLHMSFSPIGPSLTAIVAAFIVELLLGLVKKK